MVENGIDPGTVFVAGVVAAFLMALISTVQFWRGVNKQAAGKVKNENRLLDRRAHIRRRKQGQGRKPRPQKPRQSKRPSKQKGQLSREEMEGWQFD